MLDHQADASAEPQALGIECVHIGGYQLGTHYVTSEPLLTSVQEFEDIGYKLSTYPTALLCPVTQTLKQVITNLRTQGVSGNDPDAMIGWRKEVEDLIGLEEYYRIESATVER